MRKGSIVRRLLRSNTKVPIGDFMVVRRMFEDQVCISETDKLDDFIVSKKRVIEYNTVCLRVTSKDLDGLYLPGNFTNYTYKVIEHKICSSWDKAYGERHSNIRNVFKLYTGKKKDGKDLSVYCTGEIYCTRNGYKLEISRVFKVI